MSENATDAAIAVLLFIAWELTTLGFRLRRRLGMLGPLWYERGLWRLRSHLGIRDATPPEDHEEFERLRNRGLSAIRRSRRPR